MLSPVRRKLLRIHEILLEVRRKIERELNLGRGNGTPALNSRMQLEKIKRYTQRKQINLKHTGLQYLPRLVD